MRSCATAGRDPDSNQHGAVGWTHQKEGILIYGDIEVRGARENYLKNISVDLPKRKITVFTGVSGAGKSSLVFDTIAAESQQLLNEIFSAFIQTLLPRYGQPDADR